MSGDLYVVEITAWDPAASGLVTLRYATRGFVTGPADTPPHTFYDGRLKQPATLKRDLFTTGATSGRSRASYGDVVLLNGDGALDALLGYGFDGRQVTIRRGAFGAAYPTGFTTFQELTAEQVAATVDEVRIKVRDRQFELDVPLQPTKYAGDNALPDGLEGTAEDLLGKPKPRCFGSVKNVPAVLVNTARLIYQVNDGPIASLGAVYDRGIALDAAAFYIRPVTSPFGSSTVYSVAYGAGLFVAGSADNKIYTSPDGETWTSRTSPFPAGFLVRGIVYGAGAGVFVATGEVGGGSAVRIAYSSDGITWTGAAATTQNALGVTWSEPLDLFCIVGYVGYTATSPDGITWTTRTNIFGGDPIGAVTWADGPAIFVAVGGAGKIGTSPDGITWTSRTTATSANDLFAVVYGNGLFVASGATGGARSWATSPDGFTWTVRDSLLPSPNATNGLAFGGGVFLAVGTGYRATSTDGLTWQVQASTSYFVAGFGNSIFVLGGVSGALARSYQTAYADAAELLDDTRAPSAGGFLPWLDGGMFRLGSPPAGLVTADVVEGPLAGDRTAGRIFARILSDHLGFPLVEFSTADVDALDAAIDAVLGLWVGTDELSVAQALDLVAQSVGACWGADRFGVLRIRQFTAPSGSPVIAFTANDCFGVPVRLPASDDTRGLPAWRSIVRHTRNHAVQGTDLAAGVTDERRAFVAKEWREEKVEDAAVQLAHPLAPETIEDSLLTDAADAAAEATRRQALRGVQRDRFQNVVALIDETDELDLFDVLTLAHPRHGLSGGPSFRVIGVDPDAAARRLTLQLWK